MIFGLLAPSTGSNPPPKQGVLSVILAPSTGSLGPVPEEGVLSIFSGKVARLSDFTLPGSSGSSGGRDSRTAAAAKVEREAKAVADLITKLEREKSLIGATDLDREISNALREAGAAATEEQKARITDLVTAIDAETKALERQKDAQEVLHNVASDTLHGIADGLRNGADAGDILKGVLDDLADKLIDLSINSIFSSPTGSAFGSGGIIGTSMSINLRRAS